MKRLLLLILIYPGIPLPAQDTLERQPPNGDHVFVRINFDIGTTSIEPVAMNQALFGSGGFDQLMTLGLTDNMSIEPLNEKGLFGFDWTWSMHWYIAEKIRRSDFAGDQIEHKLDGWEFMMSNTGLDLFANRTFDLVVAPGTCFGNLKLFHTNITNSTEQKLYKNPFVAPMARAEFRLNFGVVTFGGRFTYRYDITRDIWQRKSEGLNPIPGYRFRNTQFIIYIGIRGPFV